MKRACFLISVVALIFSCRENKVQTTAIFKVDSLIDTKQILSLDKIRFDFNIHYDKKNKKYIKVNAALFNKNIDTVYFLTWSCDGLVYDFIYDTTKLNLTPHYLCNASYPVVEKIPPNGQLDFDADFELKKKDRKIKLSYNFYRVEKGFDTNTDIHQIIKYQENRQNTILFTTEKRIE